MASAEGAVIKLPTKEKDAVAKIQSELEEFSNFIQMSRQFEEGLDFVKEWVDNEITQRVDKIVASAKGLVGGMVNGLMESMVPT